MRFLFILFFFLTFAESYAQYQKQNDIFPKFGAYEKKGWIFKPSVTQTLGQFKDPVDRLWVASDSVFDVNYSAKGKTAVGLEIGRFYAIENSQLISFVDFSAGVKLLQGAEEFEATLDDPDRSTPYTVSGGGIFQHTYATASFSATNAKPLSRNVFLRNTLGLNGDFRVQDKREYDTRGMPMQQEYPTRFVFQAHYKIGIGITLSKNMILVPSVETPIVTFYEYDDMKSTLAVFRSRYRPLIFRLTLMILDKKPDRKCPPKKGKRKRNETLFGMAGTDRPW